MKLVLIHLSGPSLGYVFIRITSPNKKATPAIPNTMAVAGFYYYLHKAPNCYSSAAFIIADSPGYANSFSRPALYQPCMMISKSMPLIPTLQSRLYSPASLSLIHI